MLWQLGTFYTLAFEKSYFKVYNNNFSAEMIPSCNENMKSPREKMIEHR